jgi:ribosome maturation factor RimP
VDIDRAGPSGVKVDDCKRVSRALGDALDESDMIEARYILEVSSPGIDRPIMTDDDYRRNVGRKLAITTAPEGGGQQQFRGELLGMEKGLIRLRTKQGSETQIPLSGVVKACQDVAF